MERKLPGKSLIDGSASKWTAAEVEQALKTHFLYDISGAITFPEVELNTHVEDDKYMRRADLLTVFCYGVHQRHKFIASRRKLYGEDKPSSSYDAHPYPLRRLPPGWRTGFEIKVSKADLQCDLKQKYKQHTLSQVCNEHYFVYPRGMVKKKIIRGQYYDHEQEDVTFPHGVGRIEVYTDDRPQWKGKLRAQIVKLCPTNMHPETPNWFLSKLLINRRPDYSPAVDEKPENT